MGLQDDNETWNAYACDTEELLQEFETALLALEHGSADLEEVNRLYRALHTLKGNSGLLGLRSIERLAHKAEDLVALVRDDGVELSSGLVEQLLVLVDTLQEGLRDIGERRTDIDASLAECVASDVGAWMVVNHPQHAAAADQALPVPAEGYELWSTVPPASPQEESTAISAAPTPTLPPERAASMPAAPGRTQTPAESDSDVPTAEIPNPPPTRADGRSTPKTEKASPAATAKPRAGTADKSSDYMRVHSRKISAIMDLAGELTLASAALLRSAAPELLEHECFAGSARKLEALIRDLQTEVSAIRLVPIANAFERMRRVVRDAAHQTDKMVDLRIVGEETEIDKLMVDGLYEPLVHAVRNAVDHGLETPAERVAAGKPEVGRILLEASSLGSEVVVRVTDDGRGLDSDSVRKRAVERGLIRATDELDEEQLAELVFLPGFSTKAEVSTLSGRGVGMDVVRTAVERLRGRVSFESEAGKGSSLVITAPVSLAFVETMIVRYSEHLYALPIERVREVFRVRQDQIHRSETDEGTRLNVRERLVPVLWLDEFYGGQTPAPMAAGQIVAVVQSARGQVAVPIGEVLGAESIMFKELHPAMTQIRAAAGCGMLRSGEIALALNCDQLLQ